MSVRRRHTSVFKTLVGDVHRTLGLAFGSEAGTRPGIWGLLSSLTVRELINLLEARCRGQEEGGPGAMLAQRQRSPGRCLHFPFR